MNKILFGGILFFSTWLYAQDISLYKQFNGRVDFTMIGNTLNLIENESTTDCNILTSSSASLNLDSSDHIEAAYLYWAGSGLGDFNIAFNGLHITAEREFSSSFTSGTSTYNFFSAFYDVTQQIQTTGNGNYTLSELDLTAVIPDYCSHGINFGGWAVIIVYSNDNLPFNQINVYDGMQSVRPNAVTIQLNNLNVIDNTGAQIGFLAWEGDSALAVSETLSINGHVIGNALNPPNNAFNSTNSFTGSTDLYNMDLDYYNIENYIDIGDTSATVNLTSGSDYVMINSIVTKLDSRLPDITISLDAYRVTDCTTPTISVEATISNLPIANKVIPTNTPVSFYIFDDDNTVWINTIYTEETILIGSSINTSLELAIPQNTSHDFTLIAKADDQNGVETLIEFDETNNDAKLPIHIPNLPKIEAFKPLKACSIGFDKAIFNLEDVTITDNPNVIVSYFENETDAFNNEHDISLPTQYENLTNPQIIYIKLQNILTDCSSYTKLPIQVIRCIPPITQVLSPNESSNNVLDLEGIYDIFPNFEITIFSRYGNIIFKGDNNSKKWDGTYHGKALPSATYFYTIQLNDGFFNELNGWIYLLN